LIVKDKIQSKSQIEKVYKKLKTREVVLYCDEIEQSVLTSLARTNIAALNGEEVIKTLVIKSPVMFKDWLYDDLVAMTGATAIDSSKGATFEAFKEEWLGTVKSWKAEKDESRLNGTKDIGDHIVEIQNQIAESKDDSMQVRLGWLNTRVAILKVGANSESELSWKIRKTIDAANASKLALKDGVVAGAGFCLSSIGVEMGGNELLQKALLRPRDIIGWAKESLDPAIVVKSALTTAVSLAGIILTTNGALVVPQYYKDLAREMAKQR
jgi:chaperonin GroEL